MRSAFLALIGVALLGLIAWLLLGQGSDVPDGAHPDAAREPASRPRTDPLRADPGRVERSTVPVPEDRPDAAPSPQKPEAAPQPQPDPSAAANLELVVVD